MVGNFSVVPVDLSFAGSHDKQEYVMKVGDKIKIDFAGKKKDALVFKLFPSSVYLKVDFENDKGKIVKRKLSQIENKKSTSNKEKKK